MYFIYLDPKELIYTKEHINKLLSRLEYDYYDRYCYEDLQKWADKIG